MNIDYKLIGERIKKARRLMGMTQEMMAEKLGVSIGYVSQVERGITKISLDLLGAISSILECDIASFITESATNSSDYCHITIFPNNNSLFLGYRKKCSTFAVTIPTTPLNDAYHGGTSLFIRVYEI